ncbi:hypothetical protein ACIBEJ_00855 [Nonomuraea sp. NPDC050790]|uniref:Acb2/Tad1 domain-containing protein n=1 Tax=Nonomuraea sp. NPDC050790 TaxID=3364371 RepID=UPI0037AEAB26
MTGVNVAEGSSDSAEQVGLRQDGLHRQIEAWFTFHPPASERRREAHVRVRSACKDLAHLLAGIVPSGDELDAAVLLLRQVAMMANAGLAIAPDPDALTVADLQLMTGAEQPGGCGQMCGRAAGQG